MFSDCKGSPRAKQIVRHALASFEAKVTFFRIPEFGASTAGGHFLTKSQLIIGDASFNLGIFWWPKLIGKFQLVMDQVLKIGFLGTKNPKERCCTIQYSLIDFANFFSVLLTFNSFCRWGNLLLLLSSRFFFLSCLGRPRSQWPAQAILKEKS